MNNHAMRRQVMLARALVLILMSMAITIANAEPAVRYKTSIPNHPPVNSRMEACAFYDSIYDWLWDPQLGFWSNGNIRFLGMVRDFSCLYTSIFGPNDSRAVGQAQCGDPTSSEPAKYWLDIQAERCVCASGVTSTSGQCLSSCPAGQQAIGRVCHGSKNNGAQTDQCVGNPILTGTGNKFQREPVWHSRRGLDLTLVYNYNDNQITPFGRRWRNSFDSQIQTDENGSIVVFRNDGRALRFIKQSGVWVSDSDIADRLEEKVDAAAARVGWQYKVASDDSVETYDAAGRLTAIRHKDGFHLSLQYSDGTAGPGGDTYISGAAVNNRVPAGRLIRVRDPFGHEIRFRYGSRDKIAQAIDPTGAQYQFSYDAELNISSITYPDGKVRRYHYNEPSNTAGANLPHALTGITDENGVRYATWHYDVTGRAISSEHAGGVEKYQLSYDANSTVVTDPLGSVRTHNLQTILGVVKNTGQSQPGGAGCGPASSAITYDANGNVASRTDFNGVPTTYSYDLARNLETQRVEAAATPEARTISTEWHPTYRLPTKIAEPKRITIHSYDDKGNLLLKTVQATSDASGAQGFAAEGVGAPRIWRYSYNQYGQVLTATGPRTDVDDTTRYAYDEQGNLSTITNAAGQVTILSNYDAHGRVGKMVDPNGLVTELTYSPRGWLTSKTVGGETTSYEYDGVGQLTKVTQPDGAVVAYTYDDAHRLTTIADSLGNRIAYMLDAMGNRVKEEVQDPDGVLSRQTTRVYDALNRLQQITGGVQ